MNKFSTLVLLFLLIFLMSCGAEVKTVPQVETSPDGLIYNEDYGQAVSRIDISSNYSGDDSLLPEAFLNSWIANNPTRQIISFDVVTESGGGDFANLEYDHILIVHKPKDNSCN